MPNWCRNYVTINGPEKQLKDFISSTPKNSNGNDGLLSKYVPIGEWEFEKAVDSWGTKWDIDEIIIGEIAEQYHYHTVDLQFDSAWTPPLEAIKAISLIFPYFQIGVHYVEDGVGFIGFVVYSNGQELVIEESDFPDFYDDLDKMSEEDQDNLATEKQLDYEQASFDRFHDYMEQETYPQYREIYTI